MGEGKGASQRRNSPLRKRFHTVLTSSDHLTRLSSDKNGSVGTGPQLGQGSLDVPVFGPEMS